MEWLIKTTIEGSVLALIILLLKSIFKYKLSAKWHLYIWLILVVRILIPILPESDFAIFDSRPSVEIAENINTEYGYNIENTYKNYEGQLEEVKYGLANEVKVHNDRASWLNLFNIWILGIAILILYFGVVYVRFIAKIKRMQLGDINVIDDVMKKLNTKGRVKLLRGGETPMLFGIFNKSIIIPKKYNEKEVEQILFHEITHYKHKDNLLNMVTVGISCIYWFNPIMWFVATVIRKDIEVLCDEKVMKITDNPKLYAQTLIKTALKRNQFVCGATSIQNGEKEIQKRIKRLVNFKKPTVLYTTIGVVIVLVISVFTLTNQPSEEIFKYTNIEQDYTITLPVELKNKIGFEKRESTLVIYSKKVRENSEWPGNIGYITKESKEIYQTRENFMDYLENYAPAPMKFLGETDTEFICHTLVTDVQFPPNDKEIEIEYRELENILITEGIQLKLLKYDNGLADILWENKTPYIGDNSKVNKLVTNLYLKENLKGIELKTDAKPYGLIINYRAGREFIDKEKYHVEKNATILFALISNLDQITVYNDKRKDGLGFEDMYVLKREDVNKDFGTDVRELAKTKEEFKRNLLNSKKQINSDDSNKDTTITNIGDSNTWNKVANKEWSNFDFPAGSGLYFHEEDGIAYCTVMVYGSGVRVAGYHKAVVNLEEENKLLISIPNKTAAVYLSNINIERVALVEVELNVEKNSIKFGDYEFQVHQGISNYKYIGEQVKELDAKGVEFTEEFTLRDFWKQKGVEEYTQENEKYYEKEPTNDFEREFFANMKKEIEYINLYRDKLSQVEKEKDPDKKQELEEEYEELLKEREKYATKGIQIMKKYNRPLD